MKIIVTGGAGFIGSNLIRFLITETNNSVLNIDKLTYAGNLNSLSDVEDSDRYEFSKTDICDNENARQLFERFQPDAVMHLAAESHVDRSIDGPSAFIQTNILGTYNLLESAKQYHDGLAKEKQNRFRFLHVSTDEVFGSLEVKEPGFSETTPYDPHSPYSASKASSDHLVRAWSNTYGLPVLITNCSNNYGPYQFPEKLVPVVILKALTGQPIPVYGNGENIRDWLHVQDHVNGLYAVLTKGTVGETYNIGGNNEQRNIDLVKMICSILDAELPMIDNPEIESEKKNQCRGYSDLITFVDDRPGHDLRYAIDNSKIKTELSWVPKENFESGFQKTVRWYLKNRDWWQQILSGNYKLKRRGTN